MSDIQATHRLKYSRLPYDNEGYVIHMLTSSLRTFLTNAYIIETKNGLVVVDTMMINSDAAQLRQYVNNLGKPLLAVIITHGHPDHYNGTHVVISGLDHIPIISTKGVKDCIQNTKDDKEVKWKPYFGDEWPEHKLLPNLLVNDDDVLNFDGLDYHFKDLGAAESSSDLYFTLGQQRSAVFLGDVVFNTVHSFLNDGNTRLWLQVLEQLLVEIGDIEHLFTGHGNPGNTRELINAQIGYISHYRTAISSFMQGAEMLSPEQRGLFEKKVIDQYPGYQLVTFIQGGIDAVTQELIKRE